MNFCNDIFQGFCLVFEKFATVVKFLWNLNSIPAHDFS